MCRAVEELIQEEKEEMIIEMIKGGKLTIEEIAAYSHLNVDVVKKISDKVTVKA